MRSSPQADPRRQVVGVVLNAVTPDEVESLERQVVPSLENLGLSVFGVMPRSPLLRSVTVGELVRRLDARVICCPERESCWWRPSASER